MSDKKQEILDTVSDLAASFLYYDRKEDESLGVGDIEWAVSNEEISVDEIANYFKLAIENYIKNDTP